MIGSGPGQVLVQDVPQRLQRVQDPIDLEIVAQRALPGGANRCQVLQAALDRAPSFCRRPNEPGPTVVGIGRSLEVPKVNAAVSAMLKTKVNGCVVMRMIFP